MISGKNTRGDDTVRVIYVSIITLVLFFSYAAFANDRCNTKNNYLISSSGEKYPILSITDCFGVDLKLENKHIPSQCLSYQEAKKLSKRYKHGFVAGSSIIEIKYHSKKLFLERYESAFASPSLSLGIYKKNRNDLGKLKRVCSIPYPECQYNFDARDDMLTVDLPTSSESINVDGHESNEYPLAKKYYGKLVSEVLVEGKCRFKR